MTRTKLIVIASLSVLISSVAFSQVVDAYSSTQIRDMLRNGIATAKAWDDDCKAQLALRPNARFDSSTDLRDLLNGKISGVGQASYHDETWISERGKGNTEKPVIVPYASTSAPLQLNSVVFLCGTMVDPDVTSNSTSAQQLLNQSSRWVTSSNARDRSPNPIGNTRTRPARTGTNIRILGLEVTSGGGSVSGGTGTDLTVSRDNNTRYWFSNTRNVTYQSDGPITKLKTVKILLTYKVIHSYNGSTHKCPTGTGGSTFVNSTTAFSSCGERTTTLTIHLGPGPYYDLTPTVTQPANNSTVDRGSSVAYRGRVRNTGTGNSPSDAYWRLTRFTLSPGANLSTAAGNTAPCDGAFTGYSGCSRVQYDNRRFNANTQWDTSSNYTDTGTNLTPGSKICYVMSVKPRKTGEDQWRHSSPSCVTIQASSVWTLSRESRVRVSTSTGEDRTNWNNYSSGAGTTVQQGQTLQFIHRVRNTGNASSGSQPVYVQQYLTTSPTTNAASHAGDYPAAGWGVDARGAAYNLSNLSLASSGEKFYYYRYTGSNGNLGTNHSRMQQLVNSSNDIYPGSGLSMTGGTYVCQRIVTKNNAADTMWRFSVPACAEIVNTYSLTPTVSASTDSIEEGATSVSGIMGNINKTGLSNSQTQVSYGISRFVWRKGVAYPNDDWLSAGGATVISGGVGSNPCAIPQAVTGATPAQVSQLSCGSPISGIRSAAISGNMTSMGSATDNVGGLALSLGDSICYVSYVNKYTPSSGETNFRYSQPTCVPLGKTPKVQFWGSDIRSDKNVATSSPTIDGKMYGSWAEYAIRSRGVVTSASGAGLSGDGRTAGMNALGYNRLTLGNTSTPYGYGTSVLSSDVPGSFKNTAGEQITSESAESFSVSDKSGEYYRADNLTITGGEIPVNGRVIIKATGTVTISDDITYASGPYDGTTSKVPQLVIYANNIVIDENVNEVNAWLIANRTSGSYVSTCGTVTGDWLTGLNSTTCNQPLKVNGPITANHLYLRRTSGSEAANRNAPAEVLNLRPDTYIWAQSETQRSGSISTQYIRELPPRF